MPRTFATEIHPLRREDMTEDEKVFNKKIVIAVDESDNARRAVSYVGQLLKGVKTDRFRQVFNF